MKGNRHYPLLTEELPLLGDDYARIYERAADLEEEFAAQAENDEDATSDALQRAEERVQEAMRMWLLELNLPRSRTDSMQMSEKWLRLKKEQQ